MPLPGHSLSLVPWPALRAFNTHPLPMGLSMVLSDRFPESVRGEGLTQSRLLGHWLFPSPHCRACLYLHAISFSSPPTHKDNAHKDTTQRHNTETQHRDATQRHNTKTQHKGTTQRHSPEAQPALLLGNNLLDLQCQHFNYGSTSRDNLE